MKARLLLDEDIHFDVAVALRKRGFDVVHVQELGRKGRSDAEQLAYAAEQNRCIFSFNVKDFVVLHNQYIQEGQKHAGIILSKQLPIGLTIHRLLYVLQTSSAETLQDQIRFL